MNLPGLTSPLQNSIWKRARDFPVTLRFLMFTMNVLKKAAWTFFAFLCFTEERKPYYFVTRECLDVMMSFYFGVNRRPVQTLNSAAVWEEFKCGIPDWCSVCPVQQGLDVSLYYAGTFVKHLSLNKQSDSMAGLYFQASCPAAERRHSSALSNRDVMFSRAFSPVPKRH